MVKRTGEKFQLIIDAAVKVIARYGYHQAQVSKIAKEAEVADGTIYLYFENKEDILVSLFDQKMGQFISQAEVQIKEKTDPREQLKALIEMHFAHLSANPELAVVTQLELRQPNPGLRRKINRILKRYLDLIDSVVRAGIEQGVFSEQTDVLAARYMIFGTLDESVTNWLMKERKYDLISMAEPVHRLFLNGLKT